MLSPLLFDVGSNIQRAVIEWRGMPASAILCRSRG
jgi:hypothetical protein